MMQDLEFNLDVPLDKYDSQDEYCESMGMDDVFDTSQCKKGLKGKNKVNYIND
jgi:hypothetical protein